MDATLLLLGGAIIALTGFLGGVSGFGQALVAAPLLLLAGLPLAFVVTATLAITALTRVSQAARFRRHISRGRVLMLVGGSVPGLYLGARVLARVDEGTVKLGAGLVVMAAAGLMLRRASRPFPASARPGATLFAGLGGGFLSSSTGLNGVVPVLLLAAERAAPLAFMADLSLYYVVSSVLALGALAWEGALVEEALYPAVALWLPGSLAGNFLGASLAGRLPAALFRRLTLGLALAAGALTAAGAVAA